jgi:2-iminoacetate synthase ThiH
MQDILTLGMQADEVRRRLLGSRVTYQRVHVVTASEFAEAVPDAASEIRLMQAPVTMDDAIGAVRRARAAAGTRIVSAYSFHELASAAHTGWGSLSDILAQLRAAGAHTIADIAADVVEDLDASIEAVRAADMDPTRITMMHAAGRDAEAVLDRVKRASASSTVTRYAPLPRVMTVDKPTTGYEDVRMVALARLALADARGPAGPLSIEVDWTTYGPKLAQVALLFGADHFDHVSPVSDPAMGPRRATVEDVHRNIRAAGFEPQEYQPLA